MKYFTKVAGIYPEIATHRIGVLKFFHFDLGWKITIGEEKGKASKLTWLQLFESGS